MSQLCDLEDRPIGKPNLVSCPALGQMPSALVAPLEKKLNQFPVASGANPRHPTPTIKSTVDKMFDLLT